ncbi:hypothetical protein BIW11_11603, partial [Tropilaelaps mercedesae]
SSTAQSDKGEDSTSESSTAQSDEGEDTTSASSTAHSDKGEDTTSESSSSSSTNYITTPYEGQDTATTANIFRYRKRLMASDNSEQMKPFTQPEVVRVFIVVNNASQSHDDSNKQTEYGFDGVQLLALQGEAVIPKSTVNALDLMRTIRAELSSSGNSELSQLKLEISVDDVAEQREEMSEASGSVIGIVFGVLAMLVLASVVTIFMLKSRRNRRAQKYQTQEIRQEMVFIKTPRKGEEEVHSSRYGRFPVQQSKTAQLDYISL